MPIHRKLTGKQNHVVHSFEYADATAREAVTGFAITDLYKLALQLDDFSLYMLTDWETPTWTAFGSAEPTAGYVYAGYGGGYLQDTDEYAPDTWTSKTDMPSPARQLTAASTIEGKGYVYGGNSGSYLQDTDEYAPDTWTSKTDMPTPSRQDLTASTIEGKGYVYGGFDSASDLQDTDEYAPDTWTSKTDMPSPARRYLAASSI